MFQNTADQKARMAMHLLMRNQIGEKMNNLDSEDDSSVDSEHPSIRRELPVSSQNNEQMLVDPSSDSNSQLTLHKIKHTKG